jgi:hypothetical protein
MGTPNKKTLAVTETLEEVGLDPIRGMAEMAMDKTVAVSIRAQMLKEPARYVAPKRKALEHGGETGGHTPPVFVIDIGPPPANGTDSV